MLKCYAQNISIAQGPNAKVVICVGGDAQSAGSTFTIDVYRMGASLVHYFTSGSQSAGTVAEPAGTANAERDYGWPQFSFPMKTGTKPWPSGVYLATVTEKTAAGALVPPGPVAISHPSYPAGNFSYKAAFPTGLRYSDPTFGYQRCIFVVRPAAPQSTILYKVPVNTYAAYNCEGLDANRNNGGGGLYANLPSHGPKSLTFHKPGIGTGSDQLFTAWDDYDPSSPRNSAAHWDAKFIAWLEGSGYAVDYTTDIDIDAAPIPSTYELLLSVGHDEYWSGGMRKSVAKFVKDGGNVAFFSGNVCYFRVKYVDPANHPSHDWLTCDKTDPQTITWYPDDPENTTTGVASRNGASLWGGPRPALGYTVQHVDHWIFDQTDLVNAGQVFGEDAHLIGYECDGAYFTMVNGVATVDGSDCTPTTFTILGYAECTPISDPAADPSCPSGGDFLSYDHAGPLQVWTALLREATNTDPKRYATMGIMKGATGGSTFTAGTTDWARALGSSMAVNEPVNNVPSNSLASSPRIDRMTRNVLANLAPIATGKASTTIATIPCVVALAACFSANDAKHHVVVATTDGLVSEFSFVAPGNPSAQRTLTTLPAGTIVGLAAFDDPAHQVFRVVIAQAGKLTELTVPPSGAPASAVLPMPASMAHIALVCAHYDPSDKTRHYGVYESDTNTATMYRCNPQGSGWVHFPLATLAPINQFTGPAQTMSSCASGFGQNVCYLLDGRYFVREVSYRSQTGVPPTTNRVVGTSVSTSYSSAAFYSPCDAMFHIACVSMQLSNASMPNTLVLRDTAYPGPGAYGGGNASPQQIAIASLGAFPPGLVAAYARGVTSRAYVTWTNTGAVTFQEAWT